MTIAVIPAAVASPRIQGIFERFRKGLPVTARDRAAFARALLGAGATLKDVLYACRIKQRDLAAAAKLATPEVSQLLGHTDADGYGRGPRRIGRERALRLYRAAAKLLGIRLVEIPEANRLLKEEP